MNAAGAQVERDTSGRKNLMKNIMKQLINYLHEFVIYM